MYMYMYIKLCRRVQSAQGKIKNEDHFEKTEVECEEAFTIRVNWSIVYSSEGQRVRSVSISTRGRNDTDFRACIN